MVVETLERITGRRGAVGLRVGAENAQQYFPVGIPHVQLELDHLVILCRLEASFWAERPEIHDFRLSSWLESKRDSGKFSGEPAAVAMIPSGNGTFRLQIMPRAKHHDEPNNLSSSPNVPLASQVSSSAKLLDRRKRNLERTPERRRVVKINSNASHSANA